MLHLRSELRRRLLAFYFTNPNASLYLRELAQRLEVDPANLSRELAGLCRQGLFVSETRGKQKYFRLNRDFPLYGECRRIVFKTVGVAGLLREALGQLAGVGEAYLYGSFARDQADAHSDIDVLIIGQPDGEQLELKIARLERLVARDINHVVMSREEFRQRRAQRDAFLEDVWRNPRVPLVPA